ncbi:MAG: RDD family protein [Myxococcales bacterium]|nr:RDD family protein [Myxococcales bacterium]
MNQNPYASPPPSNPGNNPYGLPPQQPNANPYGSPNPSAGYNPYAPPQAGLEAAPWATPMLGSEDILAERGTRLGAQFVDGLLYGGAMIPMVILAAAAEEAGMVIGLLFPFALAIYQWYLITTTGQTLAKKWLGIRIVRLDGSPVDFVHGVLLRSWVMQAAASFIPLVGLVDALLIFGDERRCLHDHLAGTKVVIAQ